MRTHTATIVVFSGAVMLSSAARAQFAGDVYFAEPSKAATVGEPVTFDVVTFAGDAPVGAAAVSLSYDPAFLDVVSVEPGPSQPLANDVTTVSAPGSLSFVVLNDEALDGPFGTVTLASVTFLPKQARPTSQPIGLEVEDLLMTDRTPFPATEGFGGRLLVSAPPTSSLLAAAPSTLSSGTIRQAGGAELEAQALELRRAGASVILHTSDGPVSVTTRAAGPKDEVEATRGPSTTATDEPVEPEEGENLLGGMKRTISSWFRR